MDESSDLMVVLQSDPTSGERYPVIAVCWSGFLPQG